MTMKKILYDSLINMTFLKIFILNYNLLIKQAIAKFCKD